MVASQAVNFHLRASRSVTEVVEWVATVSLKAVPKIRCPVDQRRTKVRTLFSKKSIRSIRVSHLKQVSITARMFRVDTQRASANTENSY